jgi:ubiquilin
MGGFGGLGGMGGFGGMGGMGGMGGLGGMGGMGGMDPTMMQSMMQNITPEMMEQMISTNPMLKGMV